MSELENIRKLFSDYGCVDGVDPNSPVNYSGDLRSSLHYDTLTWKQLGFLLAELDRVTAELERYQSGLAIVDEVKKLTSQRDRLIGSVNDLMESDVCDVCYENECGQDCECPCHSNKESTEIQARLLLKEIEAGK